MARRRRGGGHAGPGAAARLRRRVAAGPRGAGAGVVRGAAPPPRRRQRQSLRRLPRPPLGIPRGRRVEALRRRGPGGRHDKRAAAHGRDPVRRAGGRHARPHAPARRPHLAARRGRRRRLRAEPRLRRPRAGGGGRLHAGRERPDAPRRAPARRQRGAARRRPAGDQEGHAAAAVLRRRAARGGPGLPAARERAAPAPRPRALSLGLRAADPGSLPRAAPREVHPARDPGLGTGPGSRPRGRGAAGDARRVPPAPARRAAGHAGGGEGFPRGADVRPGARRRREPGLRGGAGRRRRRAAAGLRRGLLRRPDRRGRAGLPRPVADGRGQPGLLQRHGPAVADPELPRGAGVRGFRP